jgi:hypothetical protein
MSHTKARIMALAVTLALIGINIFLWHKAKTTGVYWPKTSLFIPFAASLMFAFVISPFTKEDNLREFGTPSRSFRHMPLAHKIALFVGLALGIAQCSHFSGKL